jgi:predicted Zn-dependent peptidase
LGEYGLSHFIEHMLFKGTRSHDVRQIADLINFLGGNFNAYTTQEYLCLHAKTVDRKAHEALDLLAEMLLDSTFPPDEIRRERQVVLEEFKMYEDSPDDLSVDTFIQNLWPNHPMGRPVIGVRGQVRQISRERIHQFWSREFRPSRLLIAIAGCFDARACQDVIRRRFGGLAEPGRPAGRSESAAPRAAPRQTYFKRPIEQAHFCLGTDAPRRTAPERFAFGLMNMILGGGMSSRLFQEIREKRGLAYSIGSFAHLFSDRGFFAVSGGASVAAFGEVLTITMNEIARICAEEVSAHELALAREQMIYAMLMGLENTEARVSRLAESVMALGRVMPLDELIKKLRQVTVAEVRASAVRYLRAGDFAASSVGPANGLKRIPARLG